MRALILAVAVCFVSAASYAASAPPGPCHDACGPIVEKGCPPINCVGTIYGGSCHAFCSATFEVSPKIQFYIDGRVLDLEPKSAKPAQ